MAPYADLHAEFKLSVFHGATYKVGHLQMIDTYGGYNWY
jgi:hypothetical protein